MSDRVNIWTHMRRTPYQAFTAVFTMFLSLLITGILGLTGTASYLILAYFEAKPQLTVFFTDTADKKESDALQEKLKKTGKVASIKYVSKEDALAIYRDQNKKDPLLLEMVTADILPASLEVTAVEPKLLKDLEPIIKQSTGVSDIVFQRDVVDTLIKWTNAIRWVGGGFSLLLVLNSVLTLMTVIGMRIALRREELEILTLIGASPWYIRKPFVFEGALYGAFGAVSAWLGIMGLLLGLRSNILSVIGSIPVITHIMTSVASSQFLIASGILFLILLGVGTLLGSVGSFIATGRFHRI